MTPEEKARVKIDQMFNEAGWKVVNRNEFQADDNAVAIREGLLNGNLEADYFLFIGGKAVGVLEAKREEVDINDWHVSDQVVTYAKNVPPIYQAWQRPLPILFKSNGKKVSFLDFRQENSNWDEINRILTPKEIVKLLNIPDFFAGLPTLRTKGLRTCQYEAIKELENSFRSGKQRALMVLATGAGKTYTACLAAYRMLSYTKMRRVLFLVDRNNLGKQAENEFATFRLTENGDAFNTIFTVNRLKSADVPSDSNVVISTIQRLFSLLKGETIYDNDEDDEDTADNIVELPENPKLPHDFFDLIIIDECHRSIYGNWEKVLEYFDKARFIGLTATPIPETVAFFDKNVVANYTLEQSIIDGVNVDCRVYRIKTKVTENGGAILEGQITKEETRYTGDIKVVKATETRNYSNNELNRSIINPAQIKLILQTYKNAVYTEMFNDPQRTANFDYLPKTLIFALNENHASNIVKIAKEVFEREDDNFVQKITYSVGDSNELIRKFRNDKDFRIAVTCTLVATGTDIKPLEVVVFMRDVESATLYTQMKGRGVRTIGDEQLRNVTPNAISKDCFFLVDAVGVTEHTMSIAGPSEGPKEPVLTLKKLLELITHGNLPDSYLKRLASTLARLYNKANDSQREEFEKLAHIKMDVIARQIYAALESGKLPSYNDINEPNSERKRLVAPITNHAEVREYILTLAAGFVTTLIPGEDELISQGFSKEEARDTTKAFEEYCRSHADKIEALRILYNNELKPINYEMLQDLEKKLIQENNSFSQRLLWNYYAVLSPDKVKRAESKKETEAITNIIQLVRFAYSQTEMLESAYPTARKYFNLWYGRKQMNISDHQREVISQVVEYIACNGACTVRDIRQTKPTEAARLIGSFGNMQNANDALFSLYNFIVLKKNA